MLTKLFIGGFPMEVDELELARMLGPFGDISTIKIVRDRKTGHCKGYAFIEMADRISAEHAVAALNGNELAGREITLNIVEQERPVHQVVEIVKAATLVFARFNPNAEIKKKRPRKTQLIEPILNGRKKENLG